MFSYEPLLVQLTKKKMTKTQLRERSDISPNTLAKISKDEYISMATLDSICKVLDCEIEDVIKHVK